MNQGSSQASVPWENFICNIIPYDNEPETIKSMEEYAKENGYEINITKPDITTKFI